MGRQEFIGPAEGTAPENPRYADRGLGWGASKIRWAGLFNMAFFIWAGFPHKINTMGLSCSFSTRMAASVNASQPMSLWEWAAWAGPSAPYSEEARPGRPISSDIRYWGYSSRSPHGAPYKYSPGTAAYPPPASRKSRGRGPGPVHGRDPVPGSPPSHPSMA